MITMKATFVSHLLSTQPALSKCRKFPDHGVLLETQKAKQDIVWWPPENEAGKLCSFMV